MYYEELKVLKTGLKISKTYKLGKRIKSLNEFYKVIESDKSIFARDKVKPTAFYFSWHLRLINNWIKLGWFWTIKPIKN